MSINIAQLEEYAAKEREAYEKEHSSEAETTTTEAVTTEETSIETPPETVIESSQEEMTMVSNEAPKVETSSNDIVVEDEKPVNVSKYTDGEFESIDDLVKEYKSLKGNVMSGDSALELLDKQSEELFGLSFSEVVAWRNIDYDKMDEFDVLAEYQEFKDPEITDLEIEAELSEFEVLKKTKEEIAELIENGDLTKAQYDTTLAKFTKRSRQARTELKEYRDNLGLDKIKIGAAATPQQKQPTEEDMRAAKESLQTYLKGVSKFKVVVDDKDGTAIDYVFNDEGKNNLIETMTNPNWIVDRWKEADGSISQAKVVRDANILQNFTKLMKAAYSEGANRALKNHVINEDNITLGQGKTVQSTNENSERSISDKLMASMM